VEQAVRQLWLPMEILVDLVVVRQVIPTAEAVLVTYQQ